jgi:hypothetical protein
MFSAQWFAAVSRLVIIPVGDAGGHDGSDGFLCQVSDFEVEPPAAFATLVTSGCSHKDRVRRRIADSCNMFSAQWFDAASRLAMIPVGDAGGHDGSDGLSCQVSDFGVEHLPLSRPS